MVKSKSFNILANPKLAAALIFLAAIMLAVSCTKKEDDTDTTINITLTANLKGLDPAHNSDAYTGAVLPQIYETLYNYHYLKRPLVLQPQLAEAMPEVSKDGLTVTIKIKKGVKFQDDECFKATGGKGRELVAEDFIYSWKRLSDPATVSDGFWIFDEKIKGLNEWREKIGKKEADYSAAIEGLQALDANTLVIKLTQPYFQLQYVLTMGYSSPLPKECVEHYGQEILNHPIGTGPYKLDSWVRNSKIILVKNPNFRGETYPTEGEPSDKAAGLLEDAGKPIPFADRVIFSEIIEDQPRWLNFVKGNLDFSDIPKDNFDTAVHDRKLNADMEKKGMKLQISEDPDVTYYAFNMDDRIVGKNKALRQAISMACDHETLISRYYNGRAINAQSMLPPAVDGYDPKYKNPYKEFNIAKAKELMKKAGYPEGKGLSELTFDAISGASSRQFAEFFQQNMAAIDIKVAIKVSTWPEFSKRLKEKKAQIWGIAWLGDYPDAQNFMQLLYGPNSSPGPNAANYKNAKFDDLYRKSMKLPPGSERTRMYQEMRDLVVEEAPWVFNTHRLAYRISHGWIKNLKRHRMVSDDIKYFRIDPKARAEMKTKL